MILNIKMILKSRNVKKIILSFDYNKILKSNLYKYYSEGKKIVFIIDKVLKNNKIVNHIKNDIKGSFFFISIKQEITTDFVDKLKFKILNKTYPDIIIAIGGGSTLDAGKAISVLITNKKKAEYYQGWDLLKNKGIYSIGIPSLSGTGAESSKTCVLLNKKKNLKLGFNSKYTCFDEVYLLPELLKKINKKLLFITATDTYFHSFELLNGMKRSKHADKLATKSLNLIKDFLISKDLKHNINLKKLMLSSFYAGEAISFGMVGLVHPFSAALSTIYGIPHCISNCIVFRGLNNYYEKEYLFFLKCQNKQNIRISRLKRKISLKVNLLYKSLMRHQKPLINALGRDFIKKLDYKTVNNIFDKI